jgi:hypothetical protein
MKVAALIEEQLPHLRAINDAIAVLAPTYNFDPDDTEFIDRIQQETIFMHSRAARPRDGRHGIKNHPKKSADCTPRETCIGQNA